MSIYHKINSVYKRDSTQKHHPIMEGVFSRPEFELLKNVNWTWEEKVDGMNMRVYFNSFELQQVASGLENGEAGEWEKEVRFAGRSDKAQLPKPLEEWMGNVFTSKLFHSVFDPFAPVILYGEGYGGKIQKGGARYGPEQRFILFDVNIGDLWLRREDVHEIGAALGIETAPIIDVGPLLEALEITKIGVHSLLSPDNTEHIAEGFVLRPEVELLDRRGHRIITKTKHKDWT